MAKKTLIITKKQLEEIVGGDSSYLDNADTDFKQDAVNKIYTGEKTDTEDSMPVTTDKFAKQLRRNYGYFGMGRNAKACYPAVVTCSKSDWVNKNVVNEDNSALQNTNFGIGQSFKDNIVAAGDSAGANAAKNGNISYDNARVIKHRMEKLQNQAMKGNSQAQQKYLNMGGKMLQDTVNQKLDNATSLVKRDKENRNNMGFQNVYQKPGGTKNKKINNVEGSAIITYDN